MSEQSFDPDWFSKPGDTLGGLMTAQGMDQGQLATRLRVEIKIVRGLLAGSLPIDKGLAARLSNVLGGSVSFWLKRQQVYDYALSRAAESIQPEVGAAWLRKFPIRELANQGWVVRPSSRTELIRNYLAYFGVSTLDEWSQRYTAFLTNVAFRTSSTFDSKLGALTAWLRQGELQAGAMSVARWNPDLLRSRLPDIRRLSRRKTPANFITQIRSICAEAGVAVVFVKAPSGCRASGAARFISVDKAMVILSFRYLSDDHFWFTFFHELGHLLLHGQSSTFVDGDPTFDDDKEVEANAFAAGTLIPIVRHGELFALPARSEAVIRFAVSVGIAPGIVVGQLQHSGIIGPNQLNFLKRRYEWNSISPAIA